MKNLHRTAPGVYTFEVSQVKVFATDTAGDADGSLVLDFKMKRITLQYEIKKR